MAERMCCVDGCDKPAGTKMRECYMHKQRRFVYGSYELPARQPRPSKFGPICMVDGCDKPVQRRGICCMHAARFDRSGTYDLIRPKQRTAHSHGYVMVRAEGHLLARNNVVFEHRLVLFDRIGYGPHLCHWCGGHINWRHGLEADHVDYNRSNNADANLVQSCHACNTRRARHRNQFSAPVPV